MSELLDALRRAQAWLPHQGPLSSFVHANTLAAHEHCDFHAALARAHEVLGAQVRLQESEFRDMLADGRIEERDLRTVFEEQFEPAGLQPVGSQSPAVRAWELLRRGLLETHWRIRAFQVAEGGADPVVAALRPRTRAQLARGARSCFSHDPQRAGELITGSQDKEVLRRRMREQCGVLGLHGALRACMESDRRAAELGFALLSGLARRELPRRPRTHSPDTLQREALQREVDEILLPVVGAFLDTGQAAECPQLDSGLFAVGLQALQRRPRLFNTVRGLVREDALATAEATLAVLADPGQPSQEVMLRHVLLERPGWAGAVAWCEHHRGGPALVDYTALRLLLVVACALAADWKPDELLYRRETAAQGHGGRADRVAQLLALSGLGPTWQAACLRDQTVPQSQYLNARDWQALETLLECCDSGWRCRVLQKARERSARRVWLRGLRSRAALGPRQPERPRVQFLCCIDDREESLRRALEEVGGQEVETLGLAGHFNLPIRWRGVEDVHGTPRHPVGLASTHRVEEQAVATPKRARRLLGAAAVWLDGSGSWLLSGAIGALLAGWWLMLLMAWRVMAPRRSEATLQRWRTRWLPRPPVDLQALRVERDGDDGLPMGLTTAEAAQQVGDALELVGLSGRYAPLIVVLGHGSTSLNNPHEAAHDCGACGGFRGDGNARTFAALANHPEVRHALTARGLTLPVETVFIGAFHDTATDAVLLEPANPLPEEDMLWLRELTQAASARDALERSRRFLSLPPGASCGEALAHVQRRSSDLSEVRPEYGHATNALLVVGSRGLTRDLFLDRRAFLHSYEPEADPEGRSLLRLLGAAVPVCAGINLEYYFSRVDPERFGAGTKLPHNLLGRFGVTNGSMGDLRTGLPWQMVEIHEPTRLLVVVLAPRGLIQSALERLDEVRRLVENRWIQLTAIDQDGCWIWSPGGFVPEEAEGGELPRVPDSLRLCRGRRDPISPALLGEGDR